MRATFDNLRAQVYEFEVEAPDGQVFEFSMRALTPAELLAIDLDHPQPQPRVVDFAGKDKDNKPVPVYENDSDTHRGEWQRKMATYIQEHRYRQIIKALEMDIPGETEAEQVKALHELGAWAISALSKAVTMVIAVGDERLRARFFHGAGMAAAEGVQPVGADAE